MAPQHPSLKLPTNRLSRFHRRRRFYPYPSTTPQSKTLTNGRTFDPSALNRPRTKGRRSPNAHPHYPSFKSTPCTPCQQLPFPRCQWPSPRQSDPSMYPNSCGLHTQGRRRNTPYIPPSMRKPHANKGPTLSDFGTFPILFAPYCNADASTLQAVPPQVFGPRTPSPPTPRFRQPLFFPQT